MLQLFRIVNEMVFIVFGALLLWVSLSGRYFFDARQPSWLILAGVLVIWGLYTWRRAHRVGPPRTRETKGPQQVLSVRVDEDAVPLLDAAWRKHGLRSRNDLVLRALGHELAALGEDDAAARFTAEEATA